MAFIETSILRSAALTWLMLAMISVTPNRPMASATICTPSWSSGNPKSKRATPELTSVPTRPSITPPTTMVMPLIAEPDDTTDAATRPSAMIEKYSAGPNLNATSATSGENSIIMTMPTLAPKKEATVVIRSATPPRPCLAIGNPSRHVTALAGVPGRFNRIEAVDPP